MQAMRLWLLTHFIDLTTMQLQLLQRILIAVSESSEIII